MPPCQYMWDIINLSPGCCWRRERSLLITCARDILLRLAPPLMFWRSLIIPP